MSNKVYQIVTDKIIKELQKGKIPWEKPWAGVTSVAFNRFSKQPYSLINQILLAVPGEYGTYKQWAGIGGQVKKGEKASMVVFWKLLQRKDEEADEDDDEKADCFPMLRYYNVFHISQIEGVKPLKEPEAENKVFNPIQRAEDVLNTYIHKEGIPLFLREQNEAYYNLTTDSIYLPNKRQFRSPEDFYSTAFHEAVHSTMPKKRCNRMAENKGAQFGNEKYSKEELVAELGSAMLRNRLGMEIRATERNTVAYIQSWMNVLKEDNKMIISASSRAEKAVKYILGEGEENI